MHSIYGQVDTIPNQPASICDIRSSQETGSFALIGIRWLICPVNGGTRAQMF